MFVNYNFVFKCKFNLCGGKNKTKKMITTKLNKKQKRSNCN